MFLSFTVQDIPLTNIPELFWYGGETSLNGVPNPKTKQTNSRIGATAAVPISKHQSLKISYNNGAYINYGGNYQNISLAWQYSWVGWAK